MKEDEKKFFITCIRYCEKHYKGTTHAGKYYPRDIINMLGAFINYKRCWYLLEKWCTKDIYNYGCSLDMGWLELDNLKGEYFEIFNEELTKSNN